MTILMGQYQKWNKRLPLTHWGLVTHVHVSKLTITGPDNGLSPGRRQAIISTNDVILLIWALGTNFTETLMETHIFSFKKMPLKMYVKCPSFCLSLNVLTTQCVISVLTVLKHSTLSYLQNTRTTPVHTWGHEYQLKNSNILVVCGFSGMWFNNSSVWTKHMPEIM